MINLRGTFRRAGWVLQSWVPACLRGCSLVLRAASTAVGEAPAAA
jgi:hypothetical protein